MKRLLTLFAIVLVTGCSVSRTDWQRSRGESFSDMILCYGGSPSRGALNRWDKERFDALVTYKDANGKEDWLFDSFLAIEPRLWGRSTEPHDVALSQEDMGGRPSGRKEHWKELADYWLAPDNGFSELDRSIEDATARLGVPPYKRKVAMNLPDAVMHEFFEDTLSSTTYWGEADGRRLDFSKPEDRAEACKWYIGYFMDRFRENNYKNIELVGFYVHCEEIPTPTKGWRWPWKKMDTYLPMVAGYLHSRGQNLLWIPYREAASFSSSENLGIDYCWMQPNYYWEGDRYTWEGTMAMIKGAGCGMEMEFDDRLLSSNPEHEIKRKDLELYFKYAKESGLYGTWSFTYFQDHNTIYNLAKSTDEGDRKVYQELCKFIAENPLRKTIKD